VALPQIKWKGASPGGGRPRTAVELAPEGALAGARSAAGQAPVYAFRALPAGAITPGIADSNVHQADVVAEALRTVLEQVSARYRYVTLVVPDTSARVFVLDFDSLPAKASEVGQVLRFRLRKMVPFDVEHAAVSYQLLTHDAGNGKGPVKVLVTVMPGPILAEYEAAVRTAGFEPGAVLPSSLAALAALEPEETALAANLSGIALTTTITMGNDLLLYRTVELPNDDPGRLDEVQRSVAVAVAWFEDKLSRRPEKLHYAGAVPAREFAWAIADSGLDVVEIAPSPESGALTTIGTIGFAGITGALAGVA
jgi:type IV pilus assembly protein PilM